jgi:hypothetical protein
VGCLDRVGSRDLGIVAEIGERVHAVLEAPYAARQPRDDRPDK